MKDGIIAIELLNERLLTENPEQAALFLLAVMFPALQFSTPIKWANIDFEAGILTIGGRMPLPLPERVLELLELARERRRDEPVQSRIFAGSFGYKSRAEYVTAIRASFQAYKHSHT